MKYLQVILFMVACACSSLVEGQTTKKVEPAEQQLRGLMKRLVVAELAQDTGFFRDVFGDDFVIGTTLGDVLNKTQALERLGSPDHKVNEFHMDDVQVRVYGTTAVVIDREAIRGIDKGNPFGGEFRFVRVLVKRSGKWRLVVAQGTPITSS